MDYGAVLVDGPGEAVLGSGDSPRFVKGLNALFQTVVIELLSDYVPGRGGSGFARALRTVQEDDENARGIFAQRLSRAREHILSAHQDVTLPLSEQIDSLDLLSATFTPDGWEVEILLVNREGEAITQGFLAGTSGS